jgi:hypothetical protein
MMDLQEIVSPFSFYDTYNLHTSRRMHDCSKTLILQVIVGSFAKRCATFKTYQRTLSALGDEDDLRKTEFSKDSKHSCPQIMIVLHCGKQEVIINSLC